MIGIMSDSHDNLPAIRAAVDFFNKKKVSLVLHAGDIISPFCVSELAKLECKAKCAYGNNDGEKKILAEKLAAIGAESAEFMVIMHEGVKICLCHGTCEEIVSALAESGRYDAVVRGHSHHPSVERTKKTLVINPGELCGYLTGKRTVALLDAAERSATIHEV
jgi:hypothetical protein